jgi:membrane protease subunit HflK
MSWTEPGKDKKSDNQGPPDLDQMLGQFWQKLKAGLRGQKAAASPKKEAPSAQPSAIAGVVLGVILLIWAVSGIFIVSPAEQGIILQFGRYHSTVESGPHWLPRFIQSKYVVNVQKILTYSYDSQMLTKDQNIVDVSVAVQYRITDPKAYLFNVSNPLTSLQQATASALRQVIGNTNLDDILTTGRAGVRDAVVAQVNDILAIYKPGILITDVALQPAKAPEQVKDAFDDAIKAQEDEQRYMNQAEAYAKEVVPAAEGKAKRIHEESTAYEQQIVLTAEGDVARYLAILPTYHDAPEVTRKRLYLNSMQNILENKHKVLLDTESKQNVLYLPLDKWAPGTNTEKSKSEAISQSAETQANATENAANKTNTAGARERLQRFAFVNPDSEVGSRGAP